jgi:hypothetical protein
MMALEVDAQFFTPDDIRDGTLEAWLQTKNPDTVLDIKQTAIGSGAILVSIITGGGVGLTVNDVLASLKTIEQAPLDQQNLNNVLINAVTVATTSTVISVLDKKSLTFAVEVTSGASGGTVKIQAVDIDGNEYDLAFIDATNGTANRQTSKVLTTGNYILVVAEQNIKIDKVQFDLSSVTDGTFTVRMYGGAL